MYVKITNTGKGFLTYQEQVDAGMELKKIRDNYYSLTSINPTPDIICEMFEYEEVSEEEVFPKPSTQEIFNLKSQELLSSCYADIYGKFAIWDKQFACDQTARDDINDLYYASQKDGFAGRYWFTVGGTEVIYITPEMVVPFKDAVVEHKDLCWNKYAVLSNKLGAIDLQSPDAVDKIRSIVW